MATSSILGGERPPEEPKGKDGTGERASADAPPSVPGADILPDRTEDAGPGYGDGDGDELAGTEEDNGDDEAEDAGNKPA